MPNIFSNKELIDRIFLTFIELSYSEIAAILEVSKGTVGGWRSGVSLPRLPELYKIQHLCQLDWQWLLTGRSRSSLGLAYAYFPCFTRKKHLIRPEAYNISRRLAASSLDLNEESEQYRNTVFAAAAYYSYATIAAAEPPLQTASALSTVPLPAQVQQIAEASLGFTDYLATSRRIEAMRAAYQPPEPSALTAIAPTAASLAADSAANMLEIPFYPDEIAAGQPLEIRDAPEGRICLDPKWCRHPENMVAVRVSATGSSMEPTIPAGAIVTIDLSLHSPEALHGKIVAIYKDGEGATIKRLRRIGSGWCGIPDNRDPQHAVITLDPGDRLIGRVTSVHYAL